MTYDDITTLTTLARRLKALQDLKTALDVAPATETASLSLYTRAGAEIPVAIAARITQSEIDRTKTLMRGYGVTFPGDAP